MSTGTSVFTSAQNQRALAELSRTYGFPKRRVASSVFQRPVEALTLGEGPRKVIFTAAHHANEWITAPVLVKYAGEYGKALQSGEKLYGIPARELSRKVTMYLIPM